MFKGAIMGSKMDNFCTFANIFLIYELPFKREKNKYKFSSCFFENTYRTISKYGSGNRFRISARLFFSAIGGYPSLLLYYWLIFPVYTSKPVSNSRTIFRITDSSLNAFSGAKSPMGYLKRVTVKISRIIKFIKASSVADTDQDWMRIQEAKLTQKK
jgi:hypothetical protein